MSASYVGLWAAAVAETLSRTAWLAFWWAVLLATALRCAIGFRLIQIRVPLALARLRSSQG